MYIHQQDWAAATRVAEQNDPAHVPTCSSRRRPHLQP